MMLRTYDSDNIWLKRPLKFYTLEEILYMEKINHLKILYPVNRGLHVRGVSVNKKAKDKRYIAYKKAFTTIKEAALYFDKINYEKYQVKEILNFPDELK